ncbi:hypothetical protein D3C84_689560 [compost metagenome]
MSASFGWRYRSSRTWSSTEEAPHGRGSLRMATTAQVLPLMSRLKPAMARTVLSVPVLMCASPAMAVRFRRLRMVPSMPVSGIELMNSAA